MNIAVKCEPREQVLADASKAGFTAAEIYLSKQLLSNFAVLARLCKQFPMRYAVHASTDGFSIKELAQFSKEIKAEVVIFHNAYWEDEWDGILQSFKGVNARLCVENIHSSHEPLKFIRRYGLSRCLDLEHLQIECAGVFEEIFVALMREASHVHLTGYQYGQDLWHTHIHHSPDHGRYLLGLLKKTEYSGLVVSEAKSSFQNYSEFKKLHDFYKAWQRKG